MKEREIKIEGRRGEMERERERENDAERDNEMAREIDGQIQCDRWNER